MIHRRQRSAQCFPCPGVGTALRGCAFVVLRPGQTIDLVEIRRFLELFLRELGGVPRTASELHAELAALSTTRTA